MRLRDVFKLFFALSCLAGPAACSSDIVIVGASGRALSGTLVQGGGAPAFDPADYSIAYLSRGGHFSSAFIGSDGAFLLPLPSFTARGVIVLLSSSLTESEVAAVLVDDTGTPEGLLEIGPGRTDLVLDDPIEVDTGVGTLLFSGAVPPETAFIAGPYGAAMLCADDQVSDCALSDALQCDPGPCQSTIPLTETITQCAPCTPGEVVFLGPFYPGSTAFTEASFDGEQDPLPDVIAPFPGVGVQGLRIEVPPVDVGGVLQPAIYLDLGLLQPKLFYDDVTDFSTYNFTFEDGERFSADDLVALDLPELPPGSTAKIVTRFTTTLGRFAVYRCACDNPDPVCTYSPTCP